MLSQPHDRVRSPGSSAVACCGSGTPFDQPGGMAGSNSSSRPCCGKYDGVAESHVERRAGEWV
jgi:hypothetical protein